jgi:hypothetical protein
MKYVILTFMVWFLVAGMVLAAFKWLFVTTWLGYFIVGAVLVALAVREVRWLHKTKPCKCNTCKAMEGLI